MRRTRGTTVIVAAVAVCALGLVAACLFLVLPRMHGDVSHVNRRVEDLGNRSEQDVEAAMDAFEEYFASEFQDCTLTDLWFNAGQRDLSYEEEYGADNVLVLGARFTVGRWADPTRRLPMNAPRLSDRHSPSEKRGAVLLTRQGLSWATTIADADGDEW